ncbi:MAG: HDOD domain-containing protein [Chloroflexota bacterium]
MAVNQHAQAQMKKVLASIDDLKPLPTTVTRTLDLMEEPDVAIGQIVSALSVDQALAARLLKLANSAYYSTGYPATTLYEVVMKLGFRRTKNVLLTLSYSSLLGRRVAGYNLGHGELWKHSIAVAATAQRLSERLAYPAPDEAYIAGLLHDIGKLTLDQFFKVNWERLLEAGRSRQLSLIEAEERLLGMDHAQVGGELARKWDLPPVLVEAIAYHHTPTFANESPQLAAIVHVANVVCLRLGIGLPDSVFLPGPSSEALRLLSLTPYEVNMLTEEFKDRLDAYLETETLMPVANH